MIRKLFGGLFVLLLLAGCASPLKLEGVNRDITPGMARNTNTYQGTKVVWGGVIINTEVRKQSTQIEVLAYPVDRFGEPDRHAQAQGRFLINHPGFLEPADYGAGRWISVVGTIGQNRPGKVGEAHYIFPVIHTSQIHLWPQPADSDTRTRFHFGIGITL